MEFDFEDLNPGAWFEEVDGKPEEGRVLVRLCEGDALDEINNKTRIRQKPTYRRGQMFIPPERYDEIKRERLIWDHGIMDWEGIRSWVKADTVDALAGAGQIAEPGDSPSLNGDKILVELKCTYENKVKLMGQSVKFASFIADCMESLGNHEAPSVEDGSKK